MSYYDGNWFKGCRVLFQECIDNGTPWDFYVMDVILQRIRYNGNGKELEIGECFIGLRELGSLVGKDHKSIKRSLKRLEDKSLIRASSEPHMGTKIKVLYASAYSDTRPNRAPLKPQLRELNIEENRKEEIYMSHLSAIEDNKAITNTHMAPQIKNAYPKRIGPTPWAKGFARLDKYITDWGAFLKACTNYAQHCDIEGLTGTKFVKGFDTFCTKGNWEEWVDYIPANPNAPKDGFY